MDLWSKLTIGGQVRLLSVILSKVWLACTRVREAVEGKEEME